MKKKITVFPTNPSTDLRTGIKPQRQSEIRGNMLNYNNEYPVLYICAADELPYWVFYVISKRNKFKKVRIYLFEWIVTTQVNTVHFHFKMSLGVHLQKTMTN